MSMMELRSLAQPVFDGRRGRMAGKRIDRLAVGVLLGLLSAEAAADSTPPRCGSREGPDWEDRRGISFLPSLGYSGTGGVYASAGILYGRQPPRCNRCNLGAYAEGVTLELAAGTRAARLSLGRGMVNPSFAGLRTRMTLERVWRRSGQAVPGDFFLGPEVQLGIGPATITTGIQWHVAGTGRVGTRFVWAGGIGY
jgi:hypothetical protein